MAAAVSGTQGKGLLGSINVLKRDPINPARRLQS